MRGDDTIVCTSGVGASSQSTSSRVYDNLFPYRYLEHSSKFQREKGFEGLRTTSESPGITTENGYVIFSWFAKTIQDLQVKIQILSFKMYDRIEGADVL